ncbi:fibronectin type III domain protein [Neobacillus bataviensis]|uniref:Fibronectin type III domain protein n=1 Tax=Neobacillus bataviensis TaxID=220685 RepID=A0A561CAR5_9BACI|nr:fibronectin type III-like domain-contianing protein [Neobacillus bataviensis]TWD88299.1 fibronectin type III domain protein [Neobacillus bataviensis]
MAVSLLDLNFFVQLSVADSLSYTNFDYNNIRVTNSGNFKDKVIVLATIKNTGDVAGRDAVQVYLSAPDGKLEKPKVELKAFAKTKELNPGEKVNVKFELKQRTLHHLMKINPHGLLKKADMK